MRAQSAGAPAQSGTASIKVQAQHIYQQFANKQVIFVAAFTGEVGPIKSDIPFVIASNPAAVASAYAAQDKFNIAIIGKDGAITSLEVMSGHPLLQQAALDAVRQWRYQPTLLNGEPVDVDTTIDVIFSLNQ